jgi:hypothetical protein
MGLARGEQRGRRVCTGAGHGRAAGSQSDVVILCESNLRVAQLLQDVLRHLHARPLAVNAHDGTRPFTSTTLVPDHAVRGRRIPQLDHPCAEAPAASDLSRAVAVCALQTVFHLRGMGSHIAWS